jgi:glycosyltransferase involved in cell wall biosynthesis
MRVLAVSAAGVLGGAERVLLDWLRALPADTALAAPEGALLDAARTERPSAAADTSAGGAARPSAALTTLPLADRPLRRRGRSAAAARDLAALGREVSALVAGRRPDVVVLSGLRPLLATAPVPLAGARRLALLHDLPPAAPGAARLTAAACRRADAIVATSGAIARGADPAGRRLGVTTVIHPGVDLGHWAGPPPPAGGPPRALVLGALVPWKRVDLALEIAARVAGLELELAGEPLPGDPPEHAQALRERAVAADLRDRVRFLGALADPRPALARAHLLLHCADAEPYGLAIVEALAAGRPVAAPAAGGPLEILTPACGRLYPPGDAAAGAAAVTELLADAGAPAAARERAGAFRAQEAAARFASVTARLAAH